MAVTETMIKNACTMKLNNGTDSGGNVKTLNQSLGSLSDSAWDATKAMAIVDALVPCLSKGVHSVQHVLTNQLFDDE